MAIEYKDSYVTKNLILNNNLSIYELSNNNLHIQIHYRKVNHSFPSPDKPINISCVSKKSSKEKSHIIDLTESDSEDNSVNKTYTLLKHNDKIDKTTTECSIQTDPIPIKMSHNSKTQTENDLQQCIIIDDDDDDYNIVENSIQIDKTENQENVKIRNQSKIFTKFYNSDIFRAKVTIIGGYNFPMVKLNGDTVLSAPTTYVIMEDYEGNNLSTSSVVQKINPIWNSKWTVLLRKDKLIEV